jgi:Tol biopolymer transport system component
LKNSRFRTRLTIALLVLGAAVFAFAQNTGVTTRVSVSSNGEQGNAFGSDWPAFTPDGRFVAFSSDASNLTREPDNNAQGDIFVHDRLTGETARVSVTTNGRPARSNSLHPSISADGRYVAFDSLAGNLVPPDRDERSDLFVHDRLTLETTLVSRALEGEIGRGNSGFPSISSDGRFVAFHSDARNLVPDDTNRTGDVFLHDRSTGTTTRVSISSDGGQGNFWSMLGKVSADGRAVAFTSDSGNLVPGDTNIARDIFVHQLP